MLEHELFLRITNNNQRFSSPDRINSVSKIEQMRNPNSVKIRILEQNSARYKTQLKEDWLLTFDTIDILWQKTRELMTNLGITTIDPLLECLPEER